MPGPMPDITAIEVLLGAISELELEKCCRMLFSLSVGLDVDIEVWVVILGAVKCRFRADIIRLLRLLR